MKSCQIFTNAKCSQMPNVHKCISYINRSPGYPEAQNGGAECVGESTETRACDVPACETCATPDGIYAITELINETSCQIW